MNKIGFVLAFALTCAAPLTSATVAVTLESIRIDLDPKNEDFLPEEDGLLFKVNAREPGLTVGRFLRNGNIESARAFAKILHPNFGVTIDLQQNLNNFPAPAFNARLTDRQGHVLANLKVSRNRRWTQAEFLGEVTRYVDRMIRFSALDAWEMFTLKRARVVARLDRDAPIDKVYLSPILYDSYRSHVAYVRRFMEFYAPGSNRSAWMLLVNGSDWAADEWLTDELAFQSRRDPSVPVVMMLDHGRLLTFNQGRMTIKVLDGCEHSFLPTDELTDHLRD